MSTLRTPFIQRTPFIRERQKIQRKPIITRQPIVSRQPICENCDNCEKCKLFSEYKDCGGNLYVAPDDLTTDMHIPRLFVVTKDVDQMSLIPEIEALEKAKKFLRLVTDVPLNRELVTAVAYSPYNILQHTIDLSKSDYMFEDMKDSLYLAGNYGVYTTALIAPIIPGVVKISKILGVINRIAPACLYFCLKFMVAASTKKVNGVYLINGYPVSEEYLVETEDGVACSEKFITYCVDTIAAYTIPKKINVCVCNNKTCY